MASFMKAYSQLRNFRFLSCGLSTHATSKNVIHQNKNIFFADGKRHLKSRVNYRDIESRINYYLKNNRIRNGEANPITIVSLYQNQCKLETEINSLRNERNKISNYANEMKDIEKFRERGQKIKQEISVLEKKKDEITRQLENEALLLTNDTHPDVPVGPEEMSATLEISGEKPNFSFKVKDHVEIASKLGLINFEEPGKITGSGFASLCNEGALLELALIQWSLTKLRKAGFSIVFPPDLAFSNVVESCGYQPRGTASQVYKVQDTNLCLIGTSEISIAGSKAGQILSEDLLPLQIGAFSHCFRMETGHGGINQKGIYRVHQFSKVEMFAFCTESQSEDTMSRFLNIQKEIFSELGLHFKVVDMATEDLGAPAYRKIDVLAWMPGRNDYGEISSLSNCTDFQARRLNIRFRKGKEKTKTNFVYTINGTACAIPRLLISILETHQQADGSVLIPKPLQSYMGNMERLEIPKPLQSGMKNMERLERPTFKVEEVESIIS